MMERYTSPYEGEVRKGNKASGAPTAEIGGESENGGAVWSGWRKGGLLAAMVLFVFVLGSIPFWIWPLDLAVSGWFYSAERGWYHALAPIWDFLYDFGVIPSVLVVAAALVVFLGGWSVIRWRRYRKIAGYLVLCMLLGPGLLINLCLKSEWGRPRPRAVEQFGGRYPFEPVLTLDPRSPGQSFPCGHCSMGYYLFSVALLLGWRSRAGMLTAAGAAAFGTLIGFARIVQGGHFASDVWWAGGLCLAISVLLFYGLNLDQNRWYDPGHELVGRKLPFSIAFTVGLAFAVLIGAVLLATPYRSQEVHSLRMGENSAFQVVLQLEGDRHEVVSGNELRIEVSGSGHGVPGSAIKSELFERPGDRVWRGIPMDCFLFRQRYSGWFREVDHETRVTLPSSRPGRMELEVRSGEVWLTGSPPKAEQEWHITFPSGNGWVYAGPLFREARWLKLKGGEFANEPAPAAAGATN